jgi:hypothetical protein
MQRVIQRHFSCEALDHCHSHRRDAAMAITPTELAFDKLERRLVLWITSLGSTTPTKPAVIVKTPRNHLTRKRSQIQSFGPNTSGRAITARTASAMNGNILE